jgi:hypothetical protein
MAGAGDVEGRLVIRLRQIHEWLQLRIKTIVAMIAGRRGNRRRLSTLRATVEMRAGLVPSLSPVEGLFAADSKLERNNAMNDDRTDRGQTDENVFAFDIADDVLEAASGAGADVPAQSRYSTAGVSTFSFLCCSIA